jgi:phosphoribosylformimino-5-aminoimidazole carboxamide ribotide isomerase
MSFIDGTSVESSYGAMELKRRAREFAGSVRLSTKWTGCNARALRILRLDAYFAITRHDLPTRSESRMIVIPAVDLQQNSLALPSGRTPAGHSVEVARNLADMGFRRLHVVESDSGWPAVEDIVRDTSASVQVGGVGTTTDIERLLRAGVDHVIVGDRGIEEPEWLADIAELYAGAIAVATDVRDRRVVRRGWVRRLPVDILDVVDELNALPLRELLVSLRIPDGGPGIGDLSLLEDVAEHSRCPVSVVGAVTSVNDLRALEHRGLATVIIEAERLLTGAIDGRRVAQEFGA